MRFCLVSTQAHWGGGEALLSSIGSELERAGHAISWILRGASEVEEQLQSSNAHVLHTLNDRGSNLVDWLATRRVLRRWVPDVVVLNDTHAVPLVGSAVWFCRAPRPVRLAYKHTVFPLRSRLKYRLLCDRLVCVSQAARDQVLAGGLAKEHTVVIHGGCQPVSPTVEAQNVVRAELGLADDQRLLVCVGNLLECKGHSDLITAMRQLVTADQRVSAVIAGEGEQRSRLEKQIQDLQLQPHVRLLGYRSDPQRLMDAADLVVHPSHLEGLSLVLIQAQMLGKPIVATAVGGTKEVLGVDSPACSAWIAQPRDPASLASQIAAALLATREPTADFQRKLQATAERTRRDFSIQSTAEQLADLAAELMPI
jgi:glycosyltransferase involved in cell wall biosynthesis